MTTRRIALVHFTASPVVGGVEALMAAQADVLHESGIEVTVIAGTGESSHLYRLVVIPELHPHTPAVRNGGEFGPPNANHPLVQHIVDLLSPALCGHEQVWVHNAFTVHLNPYLTVALEIVRAEMRGIRWVAFCHDLSAVSSFWHGPAAPQNRLDSYDGGPNIRYVALSPARRAELATGLGTPEDEILIIPPPLDVFSWLRTGAETREIASQTGLLERDITFLVPAKLLPHKRIELAVQALAALRGSGINALGLVTGAPSAHEPVVSEQLATDLAALAQEAGVGDNFRLLAETADRIPSQQTVRALMSLCDLVFLPSAEEGYGTPINEAAALRVPVLCSDIPAFRDAAGSFADYFQGEDAHAIAGLMMITAGRPENIRRREVMRSMGRFRDSISGLVARDVTPDVQQRAASTRYHENTRSSNTLRMDSWESASRPGPATER